MSEANVRAASAAGDETMFRLARLGSLQHGQAATWQLLALGLSADSIKRLCGRGYLHRRHRGIYSVGFPATARRAELMAATLAAGPGAHLSHESTCELLDVWAPQDGAPIAVSVTRPGGQEQPDIRIHRNCRLSPADVTVIDGIPTTTAPRALMDLAPRVGPAVLDSLVGRAYRRGLLEGQTLRSLLARSKGLRGVAMLRLATEELWMDPERLRSLLEARMLRLCREHPTAPAPLVNQPLRVGGRVIEPDFRWPAARLIIETDGFAFHDGPRAQDADRSRDQDLQLEGWKVFRFTWRHVTREPWRVGRVLDRFFGTGGG